jgi:hypothetical protein
VRPRPLREAGADGRDDVGAVVLVAEQLIEPGVGRAEVLVADPREAVERVILVLADPPERVFITQVVTLPFGAT